MIQKDLLTLLVCPATRQPLVEGDAELLARLNAEVAAGRLENAGGTAVTEPLEVVLVREDGRVGYPVRNGIPVLLEEEGLPLGEA